MVSKETWEVHGVGSIFTSEGTSELEDERFWSAILRNVLNQGVRPSSFDQFNPLISAPSSIDILSWLYDFNQIKSRRPNWTLSPPPTDPVSEPRQ